MKAPTLLLALLAFPSATPFAAPLPTVRVLPADLQMRIAQAAVAACQRQNVHVAAAVVDAAATLRVLIAGDGTRAIDVDSARLKAEAAAALDAPTDRVAAAVDAAPAYDRMLRSLRPGLLLAPGGLPIDVGTDRLGAIGVGGAPNGQIDTQCAAAGLATIRDRLQ